MTIREIVEKMEAHHAPLEAGRRTCDGIITGDPDKACTGVALTCCPTAPVIQKAADQGHKKAKEALERLSAAQPQARPQQNAKPAPAKKAEASKKRSWWPFKKK